MRGGLNIFLLRLFATGAFALVLLAGTAQALETKAKAAIVIDYNTGTVLLEKNPDEILPPASMSKLMTLNMVFEALEDGRLSLDEELPVSEHAMSYKGSSMYLTTRDKVRVEDLIRGVIVLSGNDASAVLAEAMAGTEAEFARTMNVRARQLGMEGSTFANSNGWPHPNQRMSPRDLAFLADRLIREFPQYYGYFSETEFAFDERVPKNRFNRNPLLKLDIGADGLKTGHTSEAGFGIVGSAKRGDRRIILMITGLDSKEDRSREAEKLMNWAFRQFVQKKIFETGQHITTANVWLGEDGSVDLNVSQSLDLLLPVAGSGDLTAQLTFDQPVPAPIEKGQVLGQLRIEVPGMSVTKLDLVAASAVAEAGLSEKIKLSAALLVQKIAGLFN